MARSSQGRSIAVTRAVAILLCVLFMVDSFAAAGQVDVGGTSGWTFQRYGRMALKRGDALVFNYNSKFHNVLQVSQADYNTCSVSSRPIKKYGSGKDFIQMISPGNYYFICGVPGHCSSGMKVAVTVR